jgi:NAD(P)H-flavin reductase
MTEARGKSVLIVAGGIGLAPLRPAIYHILRHRGDYNRLVCR